MCWLIHSLGKFVRSDDGATLVEYGIALVLAITVGTTALLALGGQISANMDAATTEMTQR